MLLSVAWATFASAFVISPEPPSILKHMLAERNSNQLKAAFRHLDKERTESEWSFICLYKVLRPCGNRVSDLSQA